MEYGVLLLRLFVGLAFVGHGTQKLFGWWGGYGPAGTGSFFSQLGYRSPMAMAVAAGLCETVGGLLLAAGLLMPLAATLLAIVMLNAISSVTWKKDQFMRGSELELAYLAVAVSLAAIGGERLSLDEAFGWEEDISGLGWAGGALAAAIIVSFFTTTWGRARPGATELPA
jgi:putative oxidoreductase